MFRLVVLTSLLAFVQSATVPNDRIVGGFPINIRRVPYQVSLQDGWHFCGGTLVAPMIVISAAHCTIDKKAKDVSVRVGSSRHNEGGTLIPVSMIINHPNYDTATLDFDISILVLSTAQTYTTEFPGLPSAGSWLQDGAWAMVSGWGDTKNPEESNDKLRAVNVPIVNHNRCNQMYGGSVTDQMLCAGNPQVGGIDACQGDSGGPLTLNDKLIGVVSWGIGCAEVGKPGVYTKVSSVRQWIKDVVSL